MLELKTTCENCGAIYEVRAINQKYCSWPCKTRAERQRRKQRNKGLADAVALAGNRVVAPDTNGLLLLLGLIKSNPTKLQFEIVGPLPSDWQPPNGFTLQQKWNLGTSSFEEDTWLLNHQTLGQ